MKTAILILIFPLFVFGQSFTFHSDTLDFHGVPGQTFDQYADIHNTSNQSLNLSIIRTRNLLPDSIWTSSICTGVLCYSWELDTLDYVNAAGGGPLLPDSTIDFHLQVYANPAIPGIGIVTMKVENQADPSDTVALTFTFSTMPTDIRDKKQILTGTYQLLPNYPNPFNPETTIPFEIGGSQAVAAKLSVYNIIGQQVAVPLNKVFSPGLYEILWDGKDKSGKPVSSGLYFYELSAGNFRMLGKMILLK
jgi:hypothetical protein